MWFQGVVSLLILAPKCDCSTNVRFSADEYTDYVNDATQLNCTVAGLLSDDIVIFSRKKTASDNEQILSSSDVSKQPKLNVSGIHISTVNLSVNYYLFILSLDSLSCGDRGTYFCKVGERQSSARLIIWQRPGIPIFTMSKIIVENRFMLAEYPLICEGEVGEPSGNIFVETYTYGSYTQYEYYNVSKETRLSEETCSMYMKLKFAVPGNMPLSLNNTAMRCVATNNFILSHNLAPPASQPKRLYVVPDTYCQGLKNGNYKHPYECTMFIECRDKRVIPDTCRTLCTHVDGVGIISCQNCSSVDCTDQATIKETSTATTVTTQAMYSATSPAYTSDVPSTSLTYTSEASTQPQNMTRVIIGSLAGIICVLLVVIVIFCFICFRRKRLKGTTIDHLPLLQPAGKVDEDIYHCIDDRKLSTDEPYVQTSTYVELPQLCGNQPQEFEQNTSLRNIMHTDHMEFFNTESFRSVLDGSKAPIPKCHSRPLELLSMVKEGTKQNELNEGISNYKFSTDDAPGKPPVYSKREEIDTTKCYEKLSSLQHDHMPGTDYDTYLLSNTDNTSEKKYDNHSDSQRDHSSVKNNEILPDNNSYQTNILADDYLTPSVYGPFHDEFSRNKHFIPIEDSDGNLKSSTSI